MTFVKIFSRRFVLLFLLLWTLASTVQGGPSNGPGTYSILDFGASTSPGKTCTGAIQAAIDACSESGGGKVIVPPGRYVSGALFLKSNLEFHLMAGAVLVGSTRFEDYPPVTGRWEGIEREVYASLLTGHDLENVAITGQGLIDAQGEVWWNAHEADYPLFRKLKLKREDTYPEGTILKYPRPRTINLYRCQNVLISDISIINSPAWTIHPVYCENLTVENVNIKQPYESPNTDGINPDSCRNVRIANCYIDVGDDCITIKSGYNADGRRVGKPCENIVITNCTFAHGRGGVVIGSEMSGDVRNITISNCICQGTLRGLRAKTSRGRGGIVENIRASNLVFNNVDIGISLTMLYSGKRDKKYPVDETTPCFRNLHFSDIIIQDSTHVAVWDGLAEMPITDLSLTNLIAQNCDKGIDCWNAQRVSLSGCSINTNQGPAYCFSNTRELEIHRCTSPDPHTDSPVILLNGVSEGFIHGCRAAPGTNIFLQQGEKPNQNILLLGNHMANAEKTAIPEESVNIE